MNKKSFFLLIVFSLVCLAIAYLIKPDTKELSYVYEKSQKHAQLKEEYSKQIKEEPKSIILQEKYMETLEVLNDEKHIPYSIEYYKKTKDPKTARKIIEYYKAQGDYKNAISWLESVHKENEDKKVLEEIISLTSFTKDLNRQSEYMQKKYEESNDTKILFDLYAMGEKDFSQKKLFNLANENKLTNDEYISTLKALIYSKKFEQAQNLYSNKKLKELNTLENQKEYIFLNITNKNDDELKKIYAYLYEETSKKEYFDKQTAIYLDEGDIDTFIELYKKRYDEKKEEKSLDTIIKYSFLNENILDYLYYLELKAIREKDQENINSILAYYIDLDELDLLESLLEKINTISYKYDSFKELSINTLLYLQENRKAEEMLLSFPVEEIDADIILATLKTKMNQRTLPYFMKALKKSKNEEAKAKLFRYKYKTSQLFEEDTFKTFGHANTFKRLNYYIEHFSKEDRNKNFLKFAKKSKDPLFIAEIAKYFLGQEDHQNTILLSEQALNIYPENQLALKNLSQTYLWTRNNDKALEYLNRSYQVNPNDSEINYYLAEVYHEKKELKKSIKHYKFVLNNIKKDSMANKRMYLNAKVRIINPFEVKEEFEEFILETNYNEFVIADLARHFFINRHYNQTLSILNTYEDITKRSKILEKIQLQTYIQTKKFNLADKLIAKLEKKYPKDRDLATLYQDLGNAYTNVKYKHNALDAYNKSLELNKTNEELVLTTEELKKDLSHNVNFSAGIRNEIKQGHIEAVYTAKKYKVKVRSDKYDDYYSPKIIASNINEDLTLGAGKDYLSLEAKNILNSNVTIEAKRSIDDNSKATISDELIYDKIGILYSSNYKDDFYYNALLEHYNYNKNNNDFNRTKIQTNIFYPFYKTYFTNFSYTYEKVNNPNKYGYVDISSPLITIGEEKTINKNFMYIYSLGAEYRDSKITPFANLNLNYRNKYINSSLENSFSKDYLTNQYNYTSMLNFTYFFID